MLEHHNIEGQSTILLFSWDILASPAIDQKRIPASCLPVRV